MIPVKVVQYAPSKHNFSAKFPDGAVHRVTILAGTTLPRGFEQGAAAWIVPAQDTAGDWVTPAIDIPWTPQPQAVVPSDPAPPAQDTLSPEVAAVLAEDPEAVPSSDPAIPQPSKPQVTASARQTPSLVAGESR